MKFSSLAAMLGLAILILTGCNTPEEDPGDNSPGSLKYELNADVVNTHGGVEGLDAMENFYQQVQKSKEGNLRVLEYTIEGDPIITDLDYDGKQINVTFDTTRDEYGNGKITTSTCEQLAREENPTNLSYYMTDCNGASSNMIQALQVFYNVKQQDLFEVELTYGDDLENKVDVTETAKQEVYKKLVLANYLDVDPLDNKCDDQEDAESYYMHIKINGGERTYRWASCDNSEDGQNLTEIAKDIIELSNNPPQRSENIINGYVISVEDNQLFVGEDLTALDYQWVKDVPKEGLLDGYSINFIYIETENAEEFSNGDKIAVELDGGIQETHPPRAKAKTIEKIK
ncbi:DUF4362 domain-containing protein [Bacillus sp. AK031]